MDLLLLSQFNLDSKLPSFFELYLVGQLTDTLKDVFRFVHAMVANHQTWAAVALPYNTEVFVALWALVERSFLQNFDSTFAERYFDIKRCVVTPLRSQRAGLPSVQGKPPPTIAAEEPAPPDKLLQGMSARGDAAAGGESPSAWSPSSAMAVQPSDASENIGFAPLTPRARLLSWIFATIAPYLEHLIQNYYTKLKDQSPDAIAEREASERSSRLWKAVHNLLLLMYPWVHSSVEIVRVGFYVGHMFDKTVFFAPSMWMLGIAHRRLERTDYAMQHQHVLFRYGILALNAVIFGLRVLQWWNTNPSRAANIAGSLTSQSLPVPPPPPPAPPLDNARPAAPGICAICAKAISNPAVNIASGHMFCYPCLREHVAIHGSCPVSGVRTTLAHIRRVYDSHDE